ncbi:MAG: hypothetical protein FWD31_14335 [Planctomycetaceae bacterium]|nr:hypothetical protein [Planctomycetaceae bacterium]
MSQDNKLPDYVASATPNPAGNRSPWLTTTAATYAGIMLWFVFWSGLPGGGASYAGGVLSQGLLFALFAVVVAAAICHFCFYYVPATLGMKTGLPLYIVGTSTYGVKGGFIMPGFLMGCLQFGWLSVNGFFAGFGFACILKGATTWEEINAVMMSPLHLGIGIVWACFAAFVGLKGIKYVGMVASYMPVFPIVVLLALLVGTIGGVGSFSKGKMMDETSQTIEQANAVMQSYNVNVKDLPGVASESISPLLWSYGQAQVNVAALPGAERDEYEKTKAQSQIGPAVTLYGSGLLGVLSVICAYIVGFFATAGAAGCDMGSNNKDAKAVQMAGLVGIAGATIFTGGIALLAIAGAQGAGTLQAFEMNPYEGLKTITGEKMGVVFMFLLTIAAFPGACFSSLIAANSFKTTLPKVNPFVSCGIGTLVACLLIVTGFAGQAGDMFTLIGASFGPVCGAMMADYLLAGKKWAGPRAGFNPAGWISFAAGFFVGGITLVVEVFLGGTMPIAVPCPPVSAFVVGFALYYVLAKAGMESKKLDMPQRID